MCLSRLHLYVRASELISTKYPSSLDAGRGMTTGAGIGTISCGLMGDGWWSDDGIPGDAGDGPLGGGEPCRD